MKRFLSRYFLHIMAILVVSLLAYCSHSNIVPSNGYYNSECANDADKESLKPITLDGPVTAKNQSPNEQQQKKEIELSIACSDLAAQWYMANITERAYWAGTLGLILLAITLIETGRASQSAADTLDIARNATKAEFQPYIEVHSLVLDFPEHMDREIFDDGEGVVGSAAFLVKDGRIQFPFTIHFSNWGKTPAQNLRFKISFEISDFGNDEVTYKGSGIDPMIDFVDYLTALDGETEFIFNSYAPIRDDVARERLSINLVSQTIRVHLSVFFKDQFSDKEREYLCVFEGYCNDGQIPKKSVKEI